MAQTPEGKVKEEIDAYLKSLGTDCWWFKPMNMGYGKNGIPDYIICYKGFFLAPEAKRKKGGKSEAWQEDRQAEIRAAGGMSERVTTVAIVKVWVTRIDEFYATLKKNSGDINKLHSILQGVANRAV